MQLLTTLFVVSICLFPSLAAAASPHIYDVPQAGLPGSQTTLVGNGFDPNATIDLYFDSTDVGLVVTDNDGSFGLALKAPTLRQSGGTILIPADAVQGQHWITAVERITQLQAQVPFTVQFDWPQYHYGPDHTGFNPYESVLGPETVGNLTTRWKGSEVDPYTAPVVANGKIYISSFDGENWNMTAFDAGTGSRLWSYPAWTSGVPAVVNGVIYVGSYEGFYALNANTGALLWSYPLGGYLSATAVVNGVVYVGSNLYVSALDATTGALLWNFFVGNYDYGFASPVTVADGIVYAGSEYQYSVYALDAGTGTPLWQFVTSDFVRYPAAVANGMVYVPAGGNIYALNANTGALIWMHESNTNNANSPAVANGVVYAGNGLSVDAFDAVTGALLWQSAVGGENLSSPVVANGVVYFGSEDHNVYALNASTGEVLWNYTTAARVEVTPVVVNGMVYIADESFNFYAFGLPDQQMSEKFSPPLRPDPARLTPDWGLQPNTPVTPSKK
jgi:outer membrane protein assembly factor BamB